MARYQYISHLPDDWRSPHDEAWDAFANHIRVTWAGCWLWDGRVAGAHRYWYFRGKQIYVHRAAYEFRKGPVPEGLEVDHTCGQRTCVNPDHLDAVTPEENKMREAMALYG